jgi:translation initiation factor 4E
VLRTYDRITLGVRMISNKLLQKDTQHFLKHSYSFWVRRGQIDMLDYEKSVKLIYTFNTVEDFWILYDHTIRPSEVSYHCDYHFFKKGIKPLWEDKENVNGGSFVIRIPHSNKVSRYWEDLVLALIGGQFDEEEEITGLVFSTRYQKDLISIWCKSTEAKTTKKIQDAIRRILGLAPHFPIDFKYHNQALKINASNEEGREGLEEKHADTDTTHSEKRW